jgi:hypothetical protein
MRLKYCSICLACIVLCGCGGGEGDGENQKTTEEEKTKEEEQAIPKLAKKPSKISAKKPEEEAPKPEAKQADPKEIVLFISNLKDRKSKGLPLILLGKVLVKGYEDSEEDGWFYFNTGGFTAKEIEEKFGPPTKKETDSVFDTTTRKNVEYKAVVYGWLRLLVNENGEVQHLGFDNRKHPKKGL